MIYLTLLEIADLLACLLETDYVTAGCIDASKIKTVGVYQREGFVFRECIGADSSYQTARIRILIHWTDNPSQTERKALEIAELFNGFEDIETQNHIIKFAEVKAVRNIGKDEKGICEYIADVDLIYTERTI
ncbi:MAG: hypothetical protein K2G83_02485 [Ruminococcus sp.]|nr:hypothetical protein [Ruminococcus sp.]